MVSSGDWLGITVAVVKNVSNFNLFCRPFFDCHAFNCQCIGCHSQCKSCSSCVKFLSACNDLIRGYLSQVRLSLYMFSFVENWNFATSMFKFCQKLKFSAKYTVYTFFSLGRKFRKPHKFSSSCYAFQRKLKKQQGAEEDYIESCAGRVNPCGLRVPAFAGRVWEPPLLCVRVRVELAAGRARGELAAGAGRAGDEKFFVRLNECWAQAHERSQLKIRKTRGCTKVVCQHCA